LNLVDTLVLREEGRHDRRAGSYANSEAMIWRQCRPVTCARRVKVREPWAFRVQRWRCCASRCKRRMSPPDRKGPGKTLRREARLSRSGSSLSRCYGSFSPPILFTLLHLLSYRAVMARPGACQAAQGEAASTQAFPQEAHHLGGGLRHPIRNWRDVCWATMGSSCVSKSSRSSEARVGSVTDRNGAAASQDPAFLMGTGL